jgi:hypothetical protein
VPLLILDEGGAPRPLRAHAYSKIWLDLGFDIDTITPGLVASDRARRTGRDAMAAAGEPGHVYCL